MWERFLDLNPVQSNLLDENLHSFIMQGAIFRSLKMAGVPGAQCAVLQGVGVIVGGGAVWHAAKHTDRNLRLGQILAAIPLILPRFGTYDLAFLAIPAVLLWGGRASATPLAQATVILFWVFPILGQVSAAIGPHVLPILSLLLLACCVAQQERTIPNE
jgi:hypothetical protein